MKPILSTVLFFVFMFVATAQEKSTNDSMKSELPKKIYLLKYEDLKKYDTTPISNIPDLLKNKGNYNSINQSENTTLDEANNSYFKNNIEIYTTKKDIYNPTGAQNVQQAVLFGALNLLNNIQF